MLAGLSDQVTHPDFHGGAELYHLVGLIFGPSVCVHYFKSSSVSAHICLMEWTFINKRKFGFLIYKWQIIYPSLDAPKTSKVYSFFHLYL